MLFFREEDGIDIVGRVEERLAPDDRKYSFGAFLYKEGGTAS